MRGFPTPHLRGYRRRGASPSVTHVGIASFTSARDRVLAAADAELGATEVCEEVVAAVGAVAPHQAAAVMTTDPETNLPAGGVVHGFDPSACVPFWDNELLDPDFNKFNDMTRSGQVVATLVEATDGDLDRSPRHVKLYAGFGAVDELRCVFLSGSLCLGIASFVRTEGEPFSATEVADVRHLVTPAAHALRAALGRHVGPAPGGAPVVLLIDADGALVSATPGAEDVLGDLRVNNLEVEGIPGTVHIAAARVRSSRQPTTTTMLRGNSSRWMRAHAALMEGTGDLVSVTIDGATPSDLIPILLDSYGLTRRETDIVLALCRGLATKEIAAELGISAHTVRDHLKVVFAKTEVTSRGELVANLFTSHVLHGFEATVHALDRG